MHCSCGNGRGCIKEICEKFYEIEDFKDWMREVSRKNLHNQYEKCLCRDPLTLKGFDTYSPDNNNQSFVPPDQDKGIVDY